MHLYLQAFLFIKLVIVNFACSAIKSFCSSSRASFSSFRISSRLTEIAYFIRNISRFLIFFIISILLNLTVCVTCLYNQQVPLFQVGALQWLLMSSLCRAHPLFDHQLYYPFQRIKISVNYEKVETRLIRKNRCHNQYRIL